MKNKLLVLLCMVMLAMVPQSFGAFVVHKNATNHPAVTTAATKTTVETGHQKHNFIYRQVHKLQNRHDVIPLGLYIILAILPLGWLGMGLNDDFEGFAWILSLLLYILFYIPGLVFTLICIPRYY